MRTIYFVPNVAISQVSASEVGGFYIVVVDGWHRKEFTVIRRGDGEVGPTRNQLILKGCPSCTLVSRDKTWSRTTVGFTGVFIIGIDEQNPSIGQGRKAGELGETPAGFIWSGDGNHHGFAEL